MKVFLKLALFYGIINVFIEESLFNYPEYFPKTKYDFSKNNLSKTKIELGRMLFYDPILSIDSTISCESCHSPYNAFSHTDHRLSHGINDKIGKRNAPPLFNLAWKSSFMRDGAVNHLDMQSLVPITDSLEMGNSLDNLLYKLKKNQKYITMFYEAFGDSTINLDRVLKSISQFELTLISKNSKYDRFRLGEDHFSDQEIRGYELFKKNCSNCHKEPMFTNYKFENNFLDINQVLLDSGRFSITKNSDDFMSFEVPSLRNLSYTYPYMHDGRFSNLFEVLKHYSGPKFNSVSLTEKETIDIISFLLTLNDKEFILNPENKFPVNKLLK
jgi:cytochrome c peroxidase